jgi:hypothetical protein
MAIPYADISQDGDFPVRYTHLKTTSFSTLPLSIYGAWNGLIPIEIFELPKSNTVALMKRGQILPETYSSTLVIVCNPWFVL